MTPSYLKLSLRDLRQRAQTAIQRLSACEQCAQNCMVDRLGGEFGVCKTGAKARVSSYGPHLGEEDPLRGWKGSGTIFFARCNLHCQFCQNYDISQADAGSEITAEGLAVMMVRLQVSGCHNINFVSPSHVAAQILEALPMAVEAGLRIPLVYNTGGFDTLETLQLLDGIVDIYMPDMKFAYAANAKKYSRIENYPKVNRAAVVEMHRQVGDLQIDQDGLATRGLLIRHLVLPGNLGGTEQIVQFLADEISTNTYLNLMAQYRPAYKASNYPELNRRITSKEYNAAVQMAKDAGLSRLDGGFVPVLF